MSRVRPVTLSRNSWHEEVKLDITSEAAPLTLGIPAAAEALGISPRHAYDLIKEGNFPVLVLDVGGVLRVPTWSVREYLQVPADLQPVASSLAGTPWSAERAALPRGTPAEREQLVRAARRQGYKGRTGTGRGRPSA